MKNRSQLTIIILLLIALVTLGAYSYFSDSKTVNVSVKTATLKLGEVKVVPTSLGQNVKPGDSGTFDVTFKNDGSIPGKYTITINNIPAFLTIDPTEKTGTVNAGDSVTETFSWNIPAEADMGTGGQEIQLEVKVNLDQIRP